MLTNGKKTMPYPTDFKDAVKLIINFLPAGSVTLHNFGNRETLTFRLKTPFLISPTGERMIWLLPPWGKACPASAGAGKGVN
jgi:hypothetical protein